MPLDNLKRELYTSYHIKLENEIKELQRRIRILENHIEELEAELEELSPEGVNAVGLP